MKRSKFHTNTKFPLPGFDSVNFLLTNSESPGNNEEKLQHSYLEKNLFKHLILISWMVL